jgi:threonine/homoserine/homoserine lactone efflux protein
MDLASLIGTVIAVTVSGALAPGPLFFTVISHGAKSGARGGFSFAFGHMLVEMPLVFALALGLSTLATNTLAKNIVAVAGSIALFAFGTLQIRDALSYKSGSTNKTAKSETIKNPVLLGAIFTGLNPFFIFWWLTIGVNLVFEALPHAFLIGVLIMYFAHVWMDYAWLTSIAHLAKIGVEFIGSRGYRVLMAIFGVILILFGITFLLSTS